MANAAIDISDGLVGDLGHVLQRSKVGAVLTSAWVADSAAISPAMQSLPMSRRLDFALAGGDDYELLFTAAPDQADAVQEAANDCGVPVTCIGRITSTPGLQVLDVQGALAQQWGVTVYPTTVLIGADGQAQWRVRGDVDWSGREAEGWLKPLSVPTQR